MTGNHVINPLRPSDPQRLGNYRIVGRLGRGGMGTVYLAETESGERAAVKVINPELADDETFRDRFRREVESARRVRRFCTAPVLDAELEGEQLYIVTEFVDGANLDEFVTSSGPMRGSSLEHLAVGVATALTAIHGAGVIHRDLKPANVLLSSVGPRVIDFGIARALDTVSGATRTGQFIGTPAYMAPELISAGTPSPASDVFAWACVVAFAGTGRAPFDGPTVPSVLYQISHGEPTLDGLDEGLRALVSQALSKDPAARPSAQQVLDILTGRPHIDTAEAADTVGRTWAVPSGRRTMPDSPMTRALPPRAPGGPSSPLLRPVVIGAAAVVALLVVAGLFFLLRGSGGPPSKTTTVFADDFSDNGSGWSGSTWISGSGYTESGYRIDAGGIYVSRWEHAPVKDSLPTSVLVSADATAKAGPPYGQLAVYCRGNGTGDDASFYTFLVRADGRGVLIRKVAGKKGAKELTQKPSAAGFKKGEKNRLQAACEQDGQKVHLRFWINGKLAAETSDGDGPLPNGGAGLMARLENGGTGGDLQALFDNFDLSTIG
ncbi:serine/threonine-protein kinase [Actinomadura sp. DC4]|uniref:serine/threonine protein kinase n=1 Tax=Actinomadura sp. DC4 TaxID=3055069 RepID=UPI0025B0C032|nr:serine/threonine-protein kinase [Actinomadura sp. DC4]MDN3357420.1 serine/threonine-protein kinase [Actinomadura sp. DC4]